MNEVFRRRMEDFASKLSEKPDCAVKYSWLNIKRFNHDFRRCLSESRKKDASGEPNRNLKKQRQQKQ